MCGIAGVWGKIDQEAVAGMVRQLEHRGPDAEGFFCSPQGAGVLGHRRLSIMDPVGGNQPIYNEEKTKAIVANGEIYNFPRLREELQERHQFRTRSDTESVLHLFEEVGTQTARHLDGMFVLAIADGEDLYLARDPIGIKPLYYGRNGAALLFASEMKALVGIAEEINEFPPGSWFHSKHGFESYYRVSEKAPGDLTADECARLVRKTLEDAIVKRLMSDVPVGAFLSGGLDSSLIAALARKHVDELHTFSVGVQGSPDLESARAAARHLRTIHHEYILTPEEVFAELPNIVYHLESFDQDLVRSAIPTYFISRLASREVKVVLTGEGADELFAGYRYYKEDFQDPTTLHRELWRSVCNLHNINLQRVDRMTMAHSLEGRVPFLDLDTIELAQTIPPELKLHSRQGRVIEKWILRKACEDLLPVENVWREKEQFDEGSGTIDLVAEKLENWMTPAEFERYARAYSEAGLCSLEEGVYHKWLCERYPDPSLVLDNVARWSERPEVKPLEDAVSMSDVEKLDADPLSKSLRTTND